MLILVALTSPLPASAQVPALTLVKNGALDLGPDGIANPGDLINYTFQVTNTGNVTLADVTVSDPSVAPITCPSGNPIPSLAVGAQETCTGSYAITQADIDAGVKNNTATATGQDPAGSPLSDDDSHSEPIPAPPIPVGGLTHFAEGELASPAAMNWIGLALVASSVVVGGAAAWWAGRRKRIE